MKMFYKFKGSKSDDIRDFVHNNKFEPDLDYIINEYLPFQIFITGRTFFKDLYVKPDIKFDPNSKHDETFTFDKEFFYSSIENYLKNNNFYHFKNPTAAVSGGVDSSTVSLIAKPKTIYSGYYTEDEFDETIFSSLVANKLEAIHIKYELKEEDFIKILYNHLDYICTPIGGYGSAMESCILQKIINDINPDCVLFGNGGDEIFLGYYFNYFIADYYKNKEVVPEYMPNFFLSKKKIIDDTINYLIIMSISRIPNGNLSLPFIHSTFLPILNYIKDIICRLLHININYTLPSLLHLNNQMCKNNCVIGLNPLANKDFIYFARSINKSITKIPKERLRNIPEILPELIRKNLIKKGFPIPLTQWNDLSNIIKKSYQSFMNRSFVPEKMKIPFLGLNRYSWGVFQAEETLRKFFN